MRNNNFKNNVIGTALVTGAARRLGRAIAIGLAKKGFNIALHYNSSDADASQVAKEIDQIGTTCQLFAFDFLDRKNIQSFFNRVVRACPDLNLLINSASIFERASLLETTQELFDQHFIINLQTPFFLTLEFARVCQSGQVINILDTKIATAPTEYFVYTLTKKALFEFTRMAAVALGPGIRVNGIGPGLILPPPGQDNAYLEEKAAHIPLQKIGNVENIVSAIYFLIDNPFITGDCIFVDGGEHLN